MQDRPIERIIIGGGPDVVLIIAGIHGNEPAGGPLVVAMIDHLLANPQLVAGRTVVILPAANPDGLAANTRHNAGNIDLNRNYPAVNRRDGGTFGPRPLSEPEARTITRVISEHWPSRIVSIHQPLSCIDYDGPAEPLARAMAAACDLPVRKLGARPGSLGAFAGETLGVPIVTLELPRDVPQSRRAMWEKYGPAMLAAVTWGE